MSRFNAIHLLLIAKYSAETKMSTL